MTTSFKTLQQIAKHQCTESSNLRATTYKQINAPVMFASGHVLSTSSLQKKNGDIVHAASDAPMIQMYRFEPEKPICRCLQAILDTKFIICFDFGCQTAGAKGSVAGLAVPSTTSWLNRSQESISTESLTIALSVLLCTLNNTGHTICMSLLSQARSNGLIMTRHRDAEC